MASPAPAHASSAALAGSPAYTTPTKRAAFAVQGEAGPSRARPAGASPAYSSRRHSLYGVEDRIIIDPGARAWKVGFSGEYEPRAVFPTYTVSSHGDQDGTSGEGAWDLDLGRVPLCGGDREEGRRLVEDRVLGLARDTFIRRLMTDSKTRKVIVLENTFMPGFVKATLAKALFDNLRVPSASFTPAPVLALTACGLATGLVVDVGWLETTVTPVYHTRPLFHLAKSTPLAGRTVARHLRALLRRYAVYHPAPVVGSTTRPAPGPIAEELLTDALIDHLLVEVCLTAATPGDMQPTLSTGAENADESEEAWLDSLAVRYRGSANSADRIVDVRPTDSRSASGAMVVPGWVCERATELLFDGDTTEAETIDVTILDTVMALPVDLRTPMLSNILITGGLPGIPGFIPRLRDAVLARIAIPSAPHDASVEEPVSAPPITSPLHRANETKAWRVRHLHPYKALVPLRSRLAILNDPAPLDGEGMGRGGKAPRWMPGQVAWVGGSLAGSLKTGAPELTREEYDTRAAHNAEKGDVYEAAILAEREAAEVARLEMEQQEKDNAEDTPEGGVKARASALASGRVVEGANLEDLLPGMALGGAERKRGWHASAGLGDWTRAVRV